MCSGVWMLTGGDRWCLGGVWGVSGGVWGVSGECLGASGGVWGVLDGVWMVFETLFPIRALCAPPPGHTGIQNPGSNRVKNTEQFFSLTYQFPLSKMVGKYI